jgi:hypothetical protein
MTSSGGPNEPTGQRPDDGVMLRPDQVVLPDEAVVPDSNLVEPAPTRFTHELVADEPYWFDRVQRTEPRTAEPDGVLPAGTPVVVLVDGERYSRVADAEGRYVEVRTASLRALPSR